MISGYSPYATVHTCHVYLHLSDLHFTCVQFTYVGSLTIKIRILASDYKVLRLYDLIFNQDVSSANYLVFKMVKMPKWLHTSCQKKISKNAELLCLSWSLFNLLKLSFFFFKVPTVVFRHSVESLLHQVNIYVLYLALTT